MRKIHPVTTNLGSPLYYRAINEGLIEGYSDFYDNKHLNLDLICENFTELSDAEYYDTLHEANFALLGNHHNGTLKQVQATLERFIKKIHLSTGTGTGYLGQNKPKWVNI